MHHKSKILIVNSNLSSAKSIRKILKENLDCDIIIAINDDTCISRLKLHKFDIILLDYLPFINHSLKILQQIISERIHAKVLIVLNEHDDFSAVTALELGAYNYIFKSTNYQNLIPHVVRNILSHTRLENQLQQTEKLCAVGQLLAGVAHELNNPLSGIAGFSKLLLSEISDKKIRNDIETIYKESLRCQKIVNNLLSFVRNYKPEREWVNINFILENVLELQSMQFKKKGILVVKKLQENLPESFVDYHKFQQVFLNILVNAYQAISHMGKDGEILIKTMYESGNINIKITDNGTGIPEKHLSKLFEPFFTTKKPGEGTGLGLSICRDIVTAHEGKIYAYNNKDKNGATFVIELPIQPRIIDHVTIISDTKGQRKRRTAPVGSYL